MTEIFNDVSDEVKRIAEITWNIAYNKENPTSATIFLDTCFSYYSKILNEQDYNFIKFYIGLKLEEMKNASDVNTQR